MLTPLLLGCRCRRVLLWLLAIRFLWALGSYLYSPMLVRRSGRWGRQLSRHARLGRRGSLLAMWVRTGTLVLAGAVLAAGRAILTRLLRGASVGRLLTSATRQAWART